MDELITAQVEMLLKMNRNGVDFIVIEVQRPHCRMQLDHLVWYSSQSLTFQQQFSYWTTTACDEIFDAFVQYYVLCKVIPK